MTETEQIARLIPIEQIRPDPDQPRRLLPTDLAQSLAAGGSPFDILEKLRARGEHNKWIRERLLELDALAQSIGDDGLMQPIRVIRDDDKCYRIEEGERRWWAYHILVQQGKDQFQNIAAFVVELESTSKGLLRRRVAENVLRSGFTAIELAQAMAKRIQEIQSVEPGIKQGEVERRVGSENGMSDRRVRQFVKLLELSPEALELVQQARLTENALRGIVGLKDSVAQLAAIRGLIQSSQSVKLAQRKGQPRKRLTANQVTNSHSERKKKARVASVTTKRARRLASRASIKNISRQHAGTSSHRGVQSLLVFARSLKPDDVRQIGVADWLKVVESKSNRQALINLHDVIERGLAITKEQREKESIVNDD